MKKNHGVYVFSTKQIVDNQEGCFGVELYRSHDGKSQLVAKVVFWDAEGQYSVETMSEVPLTILEELIQEARNTGR